MDTLTAIEQRRSVKWYDPAHPMTDEQIRRLINLPPNHVIALAVAVGKALKPALVFDHS